MLNLNNKGFAITGILYTLLILFLMILLSVLGGLSSRKSMLETSTEVLQESFAGSNENAATNIEYVNQNQTAPVTGKYIFELDSAKNLLQGLDDTDSQVETSRFQYTVSNKKVTVTAKVDNGYGVIGEARVILEAGTSYTFRCSTNGTWGTSTTTDTVEAYLLLNKATTTYIRLRSNDNFTFTPTTSGTYYLRLDVNSKGKTHDFYDFRITDNASKMTCFSYLNQGDKITKSSLANKLVPKDCNDYDYTLSFVNENPDGMKMTLKDIYSFEEE